MLQKSLITNRKQYSAIKTCLGQAYTSYFLNHVRYTSQSGFLWRINRVYFPHWRLVRTPRTLHVDC